MLIEYEERFPFPEMGEGGREDMNKSRLAAIAAGVALVLTVAVPVVVIVYPGHVSS